MASGCCLLVPSAPTWHSSLPAPTRCSAQAANVTGTLGAKVTGKRLAAAGKENGVGLASSAYSAKDEMPAAPTQQHRRTESRGYDRYGDQNYGARGDPVPAW